MQNGPESPSQHGQTPQVCVVGAGIAGLRAAAILVQKGIKPTVFEARDRAFGRCTYGKPTGYQVDLGPNWIHNVASSPFTHLAAHPDVTTHAMGELHSIFDEAGNYMDQDQARAEYRFAWKILEEAQKYSKDLTESIKPSISLLDWFKDSVAKMDLPENTKHRLPLIAEMWGAFIGTDARRQSLKFLWLDGGYEESRFMATTYEPLLVHLSRLGLDGADVHFDTEVTRIECQPSKDFRERVQLHTNGGIFSFDEVILTTPLGWLKSNQESFIPPLPERLSTAIDNTTMGKLEKAFFTFPTAFWDSNLAAESKHFPGETLFLRPSYARKTNASQTYQEVVSLSCLPAPHCHPTLMFYVFGENAAALTSSLSEHRQESQEYRGILIDFFIPYISRLPGYSPSCVPEIVYMTSWQLDRFAGYGSFTNFQVGIENAAEDLEVLRNAGGMGPDRGIWFAGEHCGGGSYGGMGTIEGAYGSGESVAQCISQRYHL